MQHSKKDPQVHSVFSTENFGTVQAVLLDAEDSIADLFKHACSKLPLPSPPQFFSRFTTVGGSTGICIFNAYNALSWHMT